MKPRRLAYCTESTKAQPEAPWYTRQADEQAIYRAPLAVERVADTDRTLTGGYLNEEVYDAVRTGRARHTGIAEAARAFNTPWLLDDAPMPLE